MERPTIKQMVITALLIGFFAYLLLATALYAMDKTWESRCGVWYGIGTTSYQRCMAH